MFPSKKKPKKQKEKRLSIGSDSESATNDPKKLNKKGKGKQEPEKPGELKIEKQTFNSELRDVFIVQKRREVLTIPPEKKHTNPCNHLLFCLWMELYPNQSTRGA